jgi:hypothetical protein
MTIQAIITGDIVNSTKLSGPKEKKLLAVLQSVLNGYTYEFYRGDSFQLYLPDAADALKVALLCRVAAISISDNSKQASDIRLSIGVGKVNTPVQTLRTAKGEAFILSGRTFDELIKTDTRLAITASPNNILGNVALQIIADYLNSIFKEMTGKQSTVIFELLKGLTQQDVADKLKKSKSTINQHVSAGKWTEIDRLLQQYENIIKQLS